MLAFSIDYYGVLFRATQSVGLFCTYYKTMMTRLKQGEYIIQNPIFRSLLNIKFPKPIYKQFK